MKQLLLLAAIVAYGQASIWDAYPWIAWKASLPCAQNWGVNSWQNPSVWWNKPCAQKWETAPWEVYSKVAWWKMPWAQKWGTRTWPQYSQQTWWNTAWNQNWEVPEVGSVWPNKWDYVPQDLDTKWEVMQNGWPQWSKQTWQTVNPWWKVAGIRNWENNSPLTESWQWPSQTASWRWTPSNWQE